MTKMASWKLVQKPCIPQDKLEFCSSYNFFLISADTKPIHCHWWHSGTTTIYVFSLRTLLVTYQIFDSNYRFGCSFWQGAPSAPSGGFWRWQTVRPEGNGQDCLGLERYCKGDHHEREISSRASAWSPFHINASLRVRDRIGAQSGARWVI